MLRSSRLPVLLALGGLTALTAVLVPAGAAPTGPPQVKGGAVSAWKATPYVDPTEAVKPGGATLFLTGAPTDEVSKQQGSPTATFSPTKPSGGSDVVQLTQPITGDSAEPRSPGTAFWEGSFAGNLSGPMSLTLHWATANASATLVPGDNIAIRVFADVDTPQQKLIGSGTSRVTNVGTVPTAVTSLVQLKGSVRGKMLIQVLPMFTDAGQDFRVYYGSSSTPSSFTLPKGKAKSAKPPTTVKVRDDRPLKISATYIGRKAAEPTLGITKAGNTFIAAADFDGLSPATPQTLIYASYDGNKTYKDVTPRVAGRPSSPTTLDPYVYVDQETSRVYSDDLLVGCSLLKWSDDEGKTWTNGNPLACDGPVDDHHTIVVGNPPAGLTTVGYPNVLYYCVNKVADVQCARSLDGGTVFSASGAPAFLGVTPGSNQGEQSTGPGVCGGLHGHIVTDPAGRLYLPKGHCGNPWLAVSEDGGMTWRTTKVHSMATSGTHTAVASDKAGNIYYLWWEAGTQLPYMAVSTDAGKTFGKPLLVGPPGLKGSNFPTIDAGEKGVVAITYPGTMDPDATNPKRPWNYYVNISYNALAKQPVFHTATANPIKDPVHRGVCNGRCAGMFDFLDVVFAPNGELWAAAVDTCTRACASAGLSGDRLTAAERPTDAQGIVVRQLR